MDTQQFIGSVESQSPRSNPPFYNGSHGFVFSADEMHKAHSEKYETAKQIAEEFNDIQSQDERMAFWDAHPKVFGLASIVMFDTYEKKYEPYYNASMIDLSSDILSHGERYKIAMILSEEPKTFWLFAEWCSKKYLPFADNPIPDEKSYWRYIKLNRYPDEYLTTTLLKAEEERERAVNLLSPHSLLRIEDDVAKKYFFFYGVQDATWRNPEGASATTLFHVFLRVLTHTVWNYGEIFAEYYYGYRAAVMVAFLREQKKRLDNGEDITVPASKIVKTASNSQPTITTPVNTLIRLFNARTRYPILIELGKLSGLPLLIYAPDYKLAQQLFDERCPGEDASEFEKISMSYCDAYNDFTNEFDSRIEALFQDKEGRIAYIKRMFVQLHEYPADSELLGRLVNNLFSDTYRPFINSRGVEFIDTITSIASVAGARNSYVNAVSSKIEQQLEIEGITTPEGWLEMERGITSLSTKTKSDLRPTQILDEETTTNKIIKIVPCPNETHPELFISSQMQTRLYKTLVIYTPTDQHKTLSALLETSSSENRIWVKTRADALADVFRQAREAANSPISTETKETATWLAAYFSWGKKAPKAVSFIYARKVLMGTLSVKKNNKIRLLV